MQGLAVPSQVAMSRRRITSLETGTGLFYTNPASLHHLLRPGRPFAWTCAEYGVDKRKEEPPALRSLYDMIRYDLLYMLGLPTRPLALSHPCRSYHHTQTRLSEQIEDDNSRMELLTMKILATWVNALRCLGGGEAIWTGCPSSLP